MADPLGPDSFHNFQWVEVKQELPDDIGVCKVSIIELPLKVDDFTEISDVKSDDVEEINNDKTGHVKESSNDLVQTPETVPCNKSDNNFTSIGVQDKAVEADTIFSEDNGDERFEHSLGRDESLDENSSDNESSKGRHETENIKHQGKAVCRYCEKTIAVKYLKEHIKRIHLIDTYIKRSRMFCVYCKENFNTRIKVIVHLQKIHNHVTEKQNLQFKHKKDFEEWLIKEESKVNCQYVKRWGDKKIKDGAVGTYLCCQDGDRQHLEKGQRKRALKSQGYRQRNITCTSHLVVRDMKFPQPRILVQYYKTHTGHLVIKNSDIIIKPHEPIEDDINGSKILLKRPDPMTQIQKGISTSKEIETLVGSISGSLDNLQTVPNDKCSQIVHFLKAVDVLIKNSPEQPVVPQTRNVAGKRRKLTKQESFQKRVKDIQNKKKSMKLKNKKRTVSVTNDKIIHQHIPWLDVSVDHEEVIGCSTI